MFGFAGHIDSWLAIARHEKIDKLEKLNGFNFPTVTQPCEQCAKFGFFMLFSAIFIWRAIASQYYILMSGFAGDIYSWLAIARQLQMAENNRK